MRTNLTEAVYSGYSCYTGIANFVPADIESAGYSVFLGHKEYIVSSDIGAGKMQYYAFHKELLVVWISMVDNLMCKKERLLQIFNGRCNNVIDLLLATDEDMLIRRDIYDRTPSLTWGRGRVTLLGDFIHAMQPNMGQGGCMAIEDSYQLALELSKAWKQSVESGTAIDIVSSLRRKMRVAIIRGMARMAAMMALTYKAYLGVGLGPLSTHELTLGTYANNEFRVTNCRNLREIKMKSGVKRVKIFQNPRWWYLQRSHGGRRSRVPPNFPTGLRPSDVIEFGSDKKATLKVKRSHPKLAEKEWAGILQSNDCYNLRLNHHLPDSFDSTLDCKPRTKHSTADMGVGHYIANTKKVSVTKKNIENGCWSFATLGYLVALVSGYLVTPVSAEKKYREKLL
ncbi:hypothetical protein GOBAR_DD08290 [Gossypium barbadense]|nr:hypothetical protein GOBAR_DD08290 [Gossypium barbadense]